MSDEYYLPLNCTICGRRRLLFYPEEGTVICEKCGADAEDLNDFRETAMAICRQVIGWVHGVLEVERE